MLLFINLHGCAAFPKLYMELLFITVSSMVVLHLQLHTEATFC